MALKSTVEEHQGIARRLAAKYSNSGMEYEDCLQIAFVALQRAIDTYQPGRAEFSTYAYRCINNEFCKQLRRQSRQKRSEGGRRTDVETLDQFAGVQPDPEQQLARRTKLELVTRAALGLPERKREILLASLDRTLADVGAAYGISRERVRQIREEAISEMRRSVCASI